MSDAAWPRVSTPDPAPLVRGIAERTGVVLEVLGRSAGGEVGTHVVRGTDGRVSILKWVAGAGRGPEVQDRVGLVDRLRARGVPAPAYELLVELPGGVAVIQERLPGEAAAKLSRGLLTDLLEVNDLLAGAGGTGPPVPLFLTVDGPGFCLHGPLRAAGGRAARVLDTIESVGAEIEEDQLPRADAVHLDFHTGNALVDPASNRLTGVVDWEAVCAGDRDFDLVTFWFTCVWFNPGSKVEQQLADLVAERLSPDRRAAYVAHMALRQVDWSLRHHDDEQVIFWLDRSEQLLALVGRG